MAQPWFKFYGADFLLDPDVDAMPREAEALLIRMWCVCHREGSCPGDVETLARKTLCSQQYVSQCKPQCEGFFELRMEDSTAGGWKRRSIGLSKREKTQISAMHQSQSQIQSQSQSQSAEIGRAHV